MKGIAATTIAGSFALAAFTIAVVVGLASGNPASSILLRAIIAMLVCYPVGLAVGLIAQRVVKEHIKAHQEANPAPDSSAILPDVAQMPEASAQEQTEDEEAIVV